MNINELIQFDLYVYVYKYSRNNTVQFRGIQDIPVSEYYGELVLGYNVRYAFRFDDSSLIRLKINEVEKCILPYTDLIDSVQDLYEY